MDEEGDNATSYADANSLSLPDYTDCIALLGGLRRINMNESHNSITQPSPYKENDITLYQLLVEELRHLHGVWIDNFRVMLTFNSLVLPASFALFVLVARGEIHENQYPIAHLLLICLAAIGNVVTVISILIIRRVKAITSLRHSEVRRLEAKISHSMSVTPFIEGFSLFGGLIDTATLDQVRNAYQRPSPIRLGRLDSFLCYSLIGCAFCVAYCIALILGVLGIMN
jgi:hypothetical protein